MVDRTNLSHNEMNAQIEKQIEFSIKLQRLIEAFCRGRELPHQELYASQMLKEYRERSEETP